MLIAQTIVVWLKARAPDQGKMLPTDWLSDRGAPV